MGLNEKGYFCFLKNTLNEAEKYRMRFLKKKSEEYYIE